MPWGYEASVIHRGGHDYRRTWFLEECEAHNLFGINEKHLPLLTHSGPGFEAYRPGTKVFLEDAPYFRALHTHHRVCGPYEVVAANLPPEAEPVYEVDGAVIVYREAHPERGPWLDHSSVRRQADGVNMRFRQIAREFHFFPFPFAIRHAAEFGIRHVAHQSEENNCATSPISYFLRDARHASAEFSQRWV
jgi:hypothetical protein